MVKKLIATDMDGTFLRADHTYDKDKFEKVLALCKEKDYLFVAASGRSLLSLEAVFEGYEDQMAFLAENGSVVSYQGQMIFEDQFLEPEIYLPILDAIHAGPYGKDVKVLLSARKGAFILEEYGIDYHRRLSPFYPNTRRVKSLSDVDEDIVKVVVTFPPAIIDEANAWINSQFPEISAVTTGFDSMDMILSGINKAIGLEHLCDYFGLTSGDVIAFGDNQNDVEMLEFAGLALVTANARETARSVADQVIGHCNDDAVVNYILDNLS